MKKSAFAFLVSLLFVPRSHAVAAPLHRIPLLRSGKPILRTYCAFWKVDNQNPHTKEFAGILKKQFQ